MSKTTSHVAILLAALLLAPPAAAGWLSSEPVTISIPHLRAGDLLLVTETRSAPAQEDGEPGSVTILLLAEGPGRVADRFGVQRDVETFRVELRQGDAPVAAVRCHRLQGGQDTVRTDFLDGGTFSHGWTSGSGALGLFGGRRGESNVTPLAHFLPGLPCEGSNRIGGRTFQEGDRVPAADLLSSVGPGHAATRSEPAVATEAHGRKALRFTFGPSSGLEDAGTVEVVLADGLPAAVSVKATGKGAQEGVTYLRELSGIERGAGPALAAYSGAGLPTESPSARFVAPPGRAFDDAAYGISFRYDDAYRALLTDPRSSFADWLERHPEAVLWYASYAKGAQGGEPGVADEGSWSLGFLDGAAGFMGGVSRASVARTPLGDVALPTGPTQAFGSEVGFDEGEPREEAFLPARVADSAAILRAAEGAGLRVSALASVGYHASSFREHSAASVSLATAAPAGPGKEEGQVVFVDASSGGLDAVYATATRSEPEGGLLAPAGAGSLRAEAPAATALSTLAGPGLGAGLAAGGAAATGLALLVVLVKLVAVPLFTRLRRDRLLDNPVRTRLYERVRAEPGIHLSELTDFAAIGKGATRHHLDQLAKHGFVVETRDGGFVRFYAAGEVPRAAAGQAMALRAGASRQVYELLAAEPHLTLRQAGARLGLSAPSVHRHKRRLQKAGLLPAPPEAQVRAAEA